MSKSHRRKYYAIRVGRRGPTIHDSLSEWKNDVMGFPKAMGKGFSSLEEALAWLEGDKRERPPRQPVNDRRLKRRKLRHTTTELPPAYDSIQENQRQPIVHYCTEEDILKAVPMAIDTASSHETNHSASPTNSTALRCKSEGDILVQDRLALDDKDVRNAALLDIKEEEEVGETNQTRTRLTDAPSFDQKRPQSPPISLSYHQQLVFDKVKRGESVFFTGSAGTGKSLLIRRIIEYFSREHLVKFVVTASTGIAGLNIGGITLHSFAGVGLGKFSAEHYARRILERSRYKFLRSRWQSTEVLMIDEISMVDGHFFDKLETMARLIRNNAAPFGGIQLIISGDFFQLPPVPDHINNIPLPVIFAFEARSWSRCFGPPIRLEKVFRQEDQNLVNMLNELRVGKVSEDTNACLKSLQRPLIYTDGIEATELFPLRSQVEAANTTRLTCLGDCSMIYTAVDRAGTDSNGEKIPLERAKITLDRLVAIREVKLKVGAQVMLIMNLVQGLLVNGSLGIVENFMTITQAVKGSVHIGIYSAEDGFPVKTEDLEKEFPFDLWPLVRFTNTRKVLCVPIVFQAINALGQLEATRRQIPLILAWALTIHKSQGQTLERVKVNLDRVFEKGQAYVALSRATTLEGLQVLNFEPSRVAAHPRVRLWQSVIDKRQIDDEIESILEDMNNPEDMEAFFLDSV